MDRPVNVRRLHGPRFAFVIDAKPRPALQRSMIRPRSKLRRGEPSKEEKEDARLRCYGRALGICEACGRYAPLNSDDDFVRGNLAHAKSKRRFGWYEDPATGQRHIWMHGECHMKSHNAGRKPVQVTKKEARGESNGK
jgi:hypothetical protein